MPREVVREFPQCADRLSKLAASNLHFGRLVDRFVSIERTLDRTRRFVEPTDDFHTGELRRQQHSLRHQIARMLEPTPVQ